MRSHLTCAAAFLGTLACASSSNSPPYQPDRIVVVDDKIGTVRTSTDNVKTVLPAPLNEVWEAMSASYTMLKIDRTTFDQARGQQGNRKFMMSRKFDNRPLSEYFQCGDDPFAGPNADANPITVSIVTTVREERGATSLETILNGSLVKPGSGSSAIYCATTGVLEKHIADMVASRLNR